MSCWAVPSVAASYLDVSIERIHEMVAQGLLASREECGFNVVDVAPDSPIAMPSPPKHLRPPTYTIFTDEQKVAA